jgi:hypothetical protein
MLVRHLSLAAQIAGMQQRLCERLEARRLLSTTFLSDLDPVWAVSPYFSGYQRDQSVSGGDLTIGGETFDKGLGTHARSELVYDLNGAYETFEASVGIDDAVGNGSIDGSSVFQVYGDGTLLAASNVLTGADSAQDLTVDISGVDQLRLVTTVGPDNDYKDHTNWAEARVSNQDAPSTTMVSVEAIQPIATTDGQSAVVRFERTGDTSNSLLVRYSEGRPVSLFIPAGESFVDVEFDVPSGFSGPDQNLQIQLIDTVEYEIANGSATITYRDTSQPPAQGETVFLSDLDPTSATSPYFDGYQRDQSVSGSGLVIGGQTFDKGLGTHARSELVYDLNGEYETFAAMVGIDDAVGNGAGDGGSVFQVYGDGQLLGESSVLTGADGPEELIVDVTGVNELTLITTVGPDNDYKDHTDWGNARVIRGEGDGGGGDPTVVDIEATDPNAAEVGADYGTFRVSRSGDTTDALKVNVSFGGTAEPLEDYDIEVSADSSVTIPAGESFVDVTLLPRRDFVTEGDETAILQIEPGTGYTIGDSAATVTIQDEETGSPSTAYLSDMTPASVVSPYNGYQADQSTDSNPLTIGGITYDKGLGTHALSELVFDLNGGYDLFEATVGIDDEVGNGAGDGSSVFQVFGDGVLLEESSLLTGADAGEDLSVDISGVDELRLVTTVGPDNDYKDHTDWAEARVSSSGVTPTAFSTVPLVA